MAGLTASAVLLTISPLKLWKIRIVSLEKKPAVVEEVKPVVDGAVDCPAQV